MAMTLPIWSTYSLHTYTASLTQWPWLCLTEVLTVYILTLPPWTNGHDSVLLKYLQSTYLHCPLDPIAITLPYWSTYSLHTYTIYTASLTQWPWLCLIGQLDGAYCTYILIYTLFCGAKHFFGSAPGFLRSLGPHRLRYLSSMQSIIVLNLNFYLQYHSSPKPPHFKMCANFIHQKSGPGEAKTKNSPMAPAQKARFQVSPAPQHWWLDKTDWLN